MSLLAAFNLKGVELYVAELTLFMISGEGPIKGLLLNLLNIVGMLIF